MKSLQQLLLLISVLVVAPFASAFHGDSDNFTLPDLKPILMIGASLSNGAPPYSNNLDAPLGGIKVNLGDYVSLGDAILMNPLSNHHVVNEAQSGATTFERLYCALPDAPCGPAKWNSYLTQLQRALSRVAIVDPSTYSVVGFNAKYVVIDLANDCIHSLAFNVPQNEAVPCTQQDMDEVVDRYVQVGQAVLSQGLTPVYTDYVDFNLLELDLLLSQGILWVTDEANYNALKETFDSRIPSEIPGAIMVDAWKGSQHLGDGLHPTERSAKIAARRVLRAILRHSLENE